MSSITADNIYSAVYSGVPVWEYIVNHVAVMRRKADSWLNATQLLKVANVEKARRTKILEREWATDSQHEKVQGGYGKYQGTWIPYERAVELCQKYKIETMVAPLLDFDPGTMTARPKPSNVRAAERESSVSSTATGNANNSANNSSSAMPDFRRYMARRGDPDFANANKTGAFMEPSPPPLPPVTAGMSGGVGAIGAGHNTSLLFGAGPVGAAAAGMFDQQAAAAAMAAASMGGMVSHAAAVGIQQHHPLTVTSAYQYGGLGLHQAPQQHQSHQQSQSQHLGGYSTSNGRHVGRLSGSAYEDGESSAEPSPQLRNARLASEEHLGYPTHPCLFYQTYPSDMAVPSSKLPRLTLPVESAAALEHHHHQQQQAMDTQSQSNSPLSPLTLQFDLAAAYASRTPAASTVTTPVFANMQIPATTSGISPHAVPVAPTSPTEGSAAYRNQWMAVFLAGSDAQAQTLCRSADKSDVNRAMDAEGNTPMHWAAALGRISVLDDLVANGADPLSVNKAGETPLMRAVNTAHNADGQSFQHVLRLCAPRVDAVQRVDRRGRTVLHHIVRAAMDLSQGCKLSAAAVYYAQELTKYVLETLKAAREDIVRLSRVCDVDGRKAVDVARGARNHDLVAHLVALDPAGSTEIVSGGCGMNSPLASSLAAAAGERTAGMCE